MVRLKHRYLLVNILYPSDKVNAKHVQSTNEDSLPQTVKFRRPSDDSVDVRMLLRLIRDGVSELFGDYGSGMIASSLQVKYFSPATSTAIIRVARDHYRLVWAALTFATQLKPLNQPCVFQVVRVSGTIKKAEEEAIRRARLSIRRAQRTSGKANLVLPGNASTVGAPVAGAEDNDDTSMGFADGIEDVDEPGDFDEDD